LDWEIRLLRKIQNDDHLKQHFSKSFEQEHVIDEVMSDLTKKERKWFKSYYGI